MPLRQTLSGFRRSGYGYSPMSSSYPGSRHRKGDSWGYSEFILVFVFFIMSGIVYTGIASYTGTDGDYQTKSRNILSLSTRESVRRRKTAAVSHVRRVDEKIEEVPFLPGQQVSVAERYRTRQRMKLPLTEKVLKLKAGPNRHFYFYHQCLNHSEMADKSDAEISTYSESEAFSNCIMDNEMAVRRKVIRRKCGKLSAEKSTYFSLVNSINTSNLWVMKKRQLVWCPVFKAASTNWMKIIPMLSNYRPAQLLLLRMRYSQSNDLARFIAHPLDPFSFVNFMSNVTGVRPVSFLIVRNPIDRLVSAFRDKLEVWREHFFDGHGKPIVAKYRERGIKRFGKEFYSKKNNFGSPAAATNADRTGREPTFWEFCRAIIDERWPGNHWDPIYKQCSMCQMKYDFVLKFETLHDEERHMLTVLGLNHNNKQRWENRSPQPLTKETRVKYFSQLRDDELTALYNVYRPDFELFEYEFNVSRYRL